MPGAAVAWAAVLAALFVAAAPANSYTAASADLALNGAVVIQWRGDAARGCAAAGVCEVSGSLTYRPGRRGNLELAGPNRRSLLPEFGGLLDSEPLVVRVRRDPFPGLCVDLADNDFADFSLTRVSGRRVRVGLGVGEMSAARCAGPRPSDLAPAMPSAVFGVRAFRKGRTLDFSERSTFTAGPFAGQAVSTVRMRVGRLGRSEIGEALDPGPPRSRGETPPRDRPRRDLVRLRLAALRFDYGMPPIQATLSWDMRGLADPDCRVLDSCGATGLLTYEMSHRGGAMGVVAARVLGRREDPTLQRELASLQGGGRYLLGIEQTFTDGAARVSQRLTPAVGPTCTDAKSSTLAPLHFGGVRKLVVAFRRPTDSQEADNPEDPFRTRCPGPAMLDVLGRRPLARAAVDSRELGKDIRVALVAATPFAAGGFTGAARGGPVVYLDHTRTRLRVLEYMVPKSVLKQLPR